MPEEEKFLSRWAKRKADARAGTLAEDEPEAAADVLEEGADPPAPADASEDDEPEDHPAAGIDIETLDYNSDFTVFMHEKVPKAIRRRALRKLWLSDPILANVDGLNDYDEDFTDAATVVEGLKAAYDEAVERMKAKEAADKAEASPTQAGEATGEEAPEQETDDELTGTPVAELDDEDLEDGTDEG